MATETDNKFFLFVPTRENAVEIGVRLFRTRPKAEEAACRYLEELFKDYLGDFPSSLDEWKDFIDLKYNELDEADNLNVTVLEVELDETE